MNIKLLLLAAAAVMATTSRAQIKGATDLEMGNYKGKVKKVQEYKDGELRTTTAFTPEGYIVYETTHGEYGDSIHNEYLSPGNPLKTTYYNKDGSYRGEYAFTYDADGKLASAVKVLEGDTIFTETYTHTAKNTMAFEHNSRTMPSTRHVIEYHPNGRLKRMITSQEGDVVSQDILVDMDNQPKEITRMGADMKVHKTTVTRTKYKITAHTSTVNADGTMTPEADTVTILDENGNPTSIKTNGTGARTNREETFEYKYDEHGNWTVREHNDSRWGKDRCERVVTYY